MSTENKNRSNFLGPLILIILLIGVFAGGLTLHYLNGNLNTAIKNKEQQLVLLQQKIKSYQRERSGKQAIKSEYKRLVDFIPTRENQEEFIWELGKLAQENNLKIGNCVFDSKLLTLKNLPKYQALQCQVTLTGSYQNILAFIDSLPGIARLVLVSKIGFTMIAGPNNNEPSQYEALITLDLIASATHVAFSQSNSNLDSSTQNPSLEKALPSPTALASVKTMASAKATPVSKSLSSVKAQPTTKKLRPSKTPLSIPSPTINKPTATSPVMNPNTGDGSPLEVKNPPIISG